MTVTDDMLPYAHWLYNIDGIGSKTIVSQLLQVGTPKEWYKLPEAELTERLSQRQKRGLAEKIIFARKKRNPHEAYKQLGEQGIHFTCMGHADYPDRLFRIPDAPYGLYFCGRLPDKTKPAAAVIGARSCSAYGRQMAWLFGSELSAAGVQIISGMARGIDGIAQQAALSAGGYSLGVMGNGVNICYPKENKALYDALRMQGGVCSEYPPGTQPRSSLFPPRNRIISALSDIVLVVEAKKRSGTLITVDMALEQGKDIYAIPGRITEALSEGCNRLLQQGAQMALSPQELLRDIAGGTTDGGAMDGRNGMMQFLSDIETVVLQNLDDAPRSPEEIKIQAILNSRYDISLPEIMGALIKLNILGLAGQVGNNHFVKA